MLFGIVFRDLTYYQNALFYLKLPSEICVLKLTLKLTKKKLTIHNLKIPSVRLLIPMIPAKISYTVSVYAKGSFYIIGGQDFSSYSSTFTTNPITDIKRLDTKDWSWYEAGKLKNKHKTSSWPRLVFDDSTLVVAGDVGVGNTVMKFDFCELFNSTFKDRVYLIESFEIIDFTVGEQN